MPRFVRRSITFAIALIVVALPSAARAQSTDPSVVGKWSGVQNWPCRAIHMILLPTGKVMFWTRWGEADSQPYPFIWDPAIHGVEPLPLNPTLIVAPGSGWQEFCCGDSALGDGRLMITGGHVSADGEGSPHAGYYDAFKNTWTSVPDMNAGRWYPTQVTLADGNIVTMAGSEDTNYTPNDLPEVYTGSGWRDLTNARMVLPLYPYLHLAPNGQVFMCGPNQTTMYLDTTGAGQWTTVGNRIFPNRDYGCSVLYDYGKILMVGGGDPPTETAEVIDLNATSPAWRAVSSMANKRRQMNATILADGTVLVTGGVSGGGFNDMTTPVYAAELWNPSTEKFTLLSSMAVGRWYHSTVVLLPDGRCLSASGEGNYNAEVFSPPYLFKGTRPTITSAPSTAQLGQAITITTPDAGSINRVHLIRLSAVTHARNMDQRICRMNYSVGSGAITATVPSDARLCPPGYYMLFLVNGSGVPSVAAIVHIVTTLTPGLPADPTSLTANTASPSQINLAWTDHSNNEDGFAIELSTDGVSFREIGTVGPNVQTYSSTGLAAGTTYYYRVRAYNSPGYSAYTNVASALTQSAGLPANPTGLTANTASSSEIDLAWTDHSNNEDGFAIERSTDGATFKEIGTVAPNVQTYASTGLAAGTTYYYRVRAYNSQGYSAYTNVANAFTQSAGLPANPTGLAVNSISASEVDLSWLDHSNNEDGFAIERSTDGVSFREIGTVGPNVQTYSSTGLAAGTTYYYRVRAYNSQGYSAYTNVVSALTQSGTATVPADPTGLTATAKSKSQINLTWTDHSNNEDGFAIERSTDGVTFKQIATVGPNVQTYTSTGLSSKRLYYYRVRAYNSQGYSAYTNVAQARTL
jgi:hypothetical protein